MSRGVLNNVRPRSSTRPRGSCGQPGRPFRSSPWQSTATAQPKRAQSSSSSSRRSFHRRSRATGNQSRGETTLLGQPCRFPSLPQARSALLRTSRARTNPPATAGGRPRHRPFSLARKGERRLELKVSFSPRMLK